MIAIISGSESLGLGKWGQAAAALNQQFSLPYQMQRYRRQARVAHEASDLVGEYLKCIKRFWLTQPELIFEVIITGSND